MTPVDNSDADDLGLADWLVTMVAVGSEPIDVGAGSALDQLEAQVRVSDDRRTVSTTFTVLASAENEAVGRGVGALMGVLGPGWMVRGAWAERPGTPGAADVIIAGMPGLDDTDSG